MPPPGYYTGSTKGGVSQHHNYLLLPKESSLLPSSYLSFSSCSCMYFLTVSSFTLMLFDRHPEYRSKWGDRYFWARGYYVSTVGNVNEETVRKHIVSVELQCTYVHDQYILFHLLVLPISSHTLELHISHCFYSKV